MKIRAVIKEDLPNLKEVIDTSGLPEFKLSRDFYLKNNYTHEASVRDFYGDGDDKVIFWKRLT